MTLCVMRIPPSASGHGGSQRAWALLQSLAEISPVDFVLISRKSDKDAQSVSLEPVRTLARTVTSIDIPGWQPTSNVSMGPLRQLHTGWFDLARMRSQEAPRLSRAELRRIAAQLPVSATDLVFAGRLPCAVVIDALIDEGLLQVVRKVVDFDDVMSGFRLRQLASLRGIEGRQARMLARIDVGHMRRAETRVAQTWDAVSVCTDHDVADLRRTYPATPIIKVPNVIDRPLLPPTRRSEGRILFIGNLSFAPNVQGLQLFLQEAWPAIQANLPTATVKVVGMFPNDDVREACQRKGVSLHANVPALEPFYADSDVVICPILFGGGTRIKVLEAMAYGRPVVATSLGAEGLNITSGDEAILADTMVDFAEGVTRLAREPDARSAMAAKARALQQSCFGLPVMISAVKEMAEGQGASA